MGPYRAQEEPAVSSDEPVEFEEKPVEVGDFRRITNHFRGIYRRIHVE
jgi:hypothetical protein